MYFLICSNVYVSQILKFADSWKTQKSKYLENITQFFPMVKKFINCTLNVTSATKR